MNGVCECAICRNRTDFHVDDFLLSEIQRQNTTIFIGAGVSTENPLSMPHTLYESVLNEIGESGQELSFPQAVERLQSLPNGPIKFIHLLEERLDYINKFRELRDNSTKFFRELATMPYFNVFITTNWDRHIEDICKAKPFVYDSDMPFWSVPMRKVLKIHGTIDDYSSIVASTSDYGRAEEALQKSLIGGKLKELLSSTTCIFIGYSLHDEDLISIYQFVENAVGRFNRTHYFISPNAASKRLPKDVRPISTDGKYFLEVVKEHMSLLPCFIPDDAFLFLEEELAEISSLHLDLWERFSPHDRPQCLLSACYQDGLIHGYQMILDLKPTGQQSHSCIHAAKAKEYEKIISARKKDRDYIDAAYFIGFQNALITMAWAGKTGEFEPAPHYYFERIGEMDYEEFSEKLEQLPDIHRSAYAQCERAMKRLGDRNLVWQKRPWQKK